jgi:hypothetical protein
MRFDYSRSRRVVAGPTVRHLARVLLITGAWSGVTPAQDTASVVTVSPSKPGPRRVRLVVAGGMAVPTGGFSSYHDLGVNASASAVMRLVGQKVRLRPEVMVSRFDVLEQKVRALVAPQQLVDPALAALARSGRATVVRRGDARAITLPKLPDLDKLRNGAISSVLASFANIEVPLGPRGLQPYIIGGVGAVSFRTDVTTVGEAIDGVQWGYNAGAGIRFRLGPLGGGLEARFRGIPVNEAKTFFHSVSTVPVSFSLVF